MKKPAATLALLLMVLPACDPPPETGTEQTEQVRDTETPLPGGARGSFVQQALREAGAVDMEIATSQAEERDGSR